ncbi:hypothetical protein HYPSUDRAFT_696036 [Hypholoma sublateritium FD-334 SS-4]|uniref:Uncharacterized protein n=1 Tax=Hypholoma sublateritium (strain FD-334 SS-4) TaxID=945553 RepID=A0A0D2MWF3_HYPSF|nr:hypothetical protein HYPSUDRAFT_696036 [Hypholoma sublateritium FD-334 SS-4]
MFDATLKYLPLFILPNPKFKVPSSETDNICRIHMRNNENGMYLPMLLPSMQVHPEAGLYPCNDNGTVLSELAESFDLDIGYILPNPITNTGCKTCFPSEIATRPSHGCIHTPCSEMSLSSDFSFTSTPFDLSRKDDPHHDTPQIRRDNYNSSMTVDPQPMALLRWQLTKDMDMAPGCQSAKVLDSNVIFWNENLCPHNLLEICQPCRSHFSSAGKTYCSSFKERQQGSRASIGPTFTSLYQLRKG